MLSDFLFWTLQEKGVFAEFLRLLLISFRLICFWLDSVFSNDVSEGEQYKIEKKRRILEIELVYKVQKKNEEEWIYLR